MEKNYPCGILKDVIVQELDGEILIYDLGNNKVFCLNETSALIWQLCDGKKDVDAISSELSKKLNSNVTPEFTWFALNELKKKKLVDCETPTPVELKGLNRREVIKRIGIGSMIALPVVAALTAPQAIHANSACVPGGACTCSMDVGMGNSCEPIMNVANRCVNTNCNCIQTNNGNTMGTCQP
ncbi:MAG TPA: PqqD family protein [Pyrinomonadaceae bacterium]|nr:PqqD family protein [Pyrinomonadaceae bacterium]